MKSKILPILPAAIAALAISQTSHAALLISGVVDGNETGGLPKAVELFATTPIADLSAFSIGRFTNGGATLSSETALPAVALAAGEFFYITGTATSDAILTGAGFTVGLSNQGVANINGDDLIAITDGSATVLDLFGFVGQGDTNFYENSVALRSNNSITQDSDGSVDAVDNFTITPWVDAATFSGQFGTFTPVPEPSATLIGGLGLLVLLRRRNR